MSPAGSISGVRVVDCFFLVGQGSPPSSHPPYTIYAIFVAVLFDLFGRVYLVAITFLSRLYFSFPSDWFFFLFVAVLFEVFTVKPSFFATSLTARSFKTA